MIQRRHVPAPPLSSFVDHMWMVRAERLVHHRQRLFPDGGITVHFNLGPPAGLVDRSTGEVRAFRRCWISGERKEPYTLECPDGTWLLGIRFRPGGAFPFLGCPAAEVTGRVVDLDLAWGREALDTWERVAEATEAEARFAAMERLLLDRLDARAWDGHAAVQGALDQLRSAGPSASIGRLAIRLGVSHRTLVRRFERHVGLRPKMIQRILRFQRVIALEEAKPDLDWSRAAHGCGYYDQAHLIRDFRAFAGLTPAEYRRCRLEYPNYVAADGSA